jgi:hypothetical protein
MTVPRSNPRGLTVIQKQYKLSQNKHFYTSFKAQQFSPDRAGSLSRSAKNDTVALTSRQLLGLSCSMSATEALVGDLFGPPFNSSCQQLEIKTKRRDKFINVHVITDWEMNTSFLSLRDTACDSADWKRRLWILIFRRSLTAQHKWFRTNKIVYKTSQFKIRGKLEERTTTAWSCYQVRSSQSSCRRLWRILFVYYHKRHAFSHHW